MIAMYFLLSMLNWHQYSLIVVRRFAMSLVPFALS